MSAKTTLVVVCVAFGLGVAYGNSNDTTKVDFIEVPRTKVVTKEVPGERVVVFPDACGEALSHAREVGAAGSALYRFSDEQLAIISDARIALASGTDLATVENKQRSLQSKTIGDLEDLVTSLDRLNREREECEATVE